MCYNYNKLNGKITEVFGTQIKFAEAMGLSERTISLKLNNLVSWKQTEITKAIDILEIPTSEIQDYFFNQKVQVKWTINGGKQWKHYL